MTITGIISNVGAPRTFEVPTTQGGKKTMTARDITIQDLRLNNTFVCDAYEDNAAMFDSQITTGAVVVAVLCFDVRTVKTSTGSSFLQQQVTLAGVQLIGQSPVL